MPVGDGFTPAELQQLDRAIRDAETTCRFEFSVFVGESEGDPRAYAEALHASLVAPSRTVLVLVDPVARTIEIVTGSKVRHELEDHEVKLVTVEMQSQFAYGDLVGGITRGITRLASYARKPRTLHA